MSADRIYLHAVKREDGKIEVLDQDGRRLAGLRDIVISASAGGMVRLILGVNDMPNGKPHAGMRSTCQ